MTNSENKAYIRDYSHEHKIRSLKKKRLICDMDKIKVEQFNEILKENNMTYSKWLNERIDEYLKKEM